MQTGYLLISIIFRRSIRNFKIIITSNLYLLFPLNTVMVK